MAVIAYYVADYLALEDQMLGFACVVAVLGCGIVLRQIGKYQKKCSMRK